MFRSSSPFKAFDLWFLSDLSRSADFFSFRFVAVTPVVLGFFCCSCSFCLWLYCALFVSFFSFCLLCGFVVFRDWVDRWLGLVLRGFGFVNPKGSVDVLDSSLDLSSYALLSQKSFLLAVFQGAVGTWILIPCWRSIHSPYLHSNCSQQCSLFILFCNLVSRPYAGSLGCACD